MKILGIETSCDETAAAVVEDGKNIISSVISSQTDLHARFGGVVPEVASRAHVELINAVIAQALVEAGLELSDLDAVAGCHGPGLAGALLVGMSAAKALSLATGLPYIGVNHLEAHLYAAWLEDTDWEFPLVVLLVSGGHTMLVLVQEPGHYQVLGQTVDDAAGEAFDKVGRFLGLGYPGGPAIDRVGAEGNPHAVEFPRPMLHDGYDFSFSGLKTAVINYVRDHPDTEVKDVAASFQDAVVDTLVQKTLRAVKEFGAKTVSIGGGVAANSLLRTRLLENSGAPDVKVLLPAFGLCTDNGAMIAAAAWWRFEQSGPSQLDDGVDPNLRLPTTGPVA